MLRRECASDVTGKLNLIKFCMLLYVLVRTSSRINRFKRVPNELFELYAEYVQVHIFVLCIMLWYSWIAIFTFDKFSASVSHLNTLMTQNIMNCSSFLLVYTVKQLVYPLPFIPIWAMCTAFLQNTKKLQGTIKIALNAQYPRAQNFI